ncbi:response regulator [Halomonas sp.]|uniref:response regulator n=1 Tax=Halomonas sp. TaxID=1486246 RepID=UPI003A0FDA20
MTAGCVAEQALEADGFDTVVLDLSLPGRSGLDILASWRRSQHLTPVLVLAAREGPRD